MNNRGNNLSEHKSFSGHFGISNKILLVVLLILFLFSIGLSVSVGITGFQKFSDITMNELNRMSAVFAKKIEELEKKSLGLVESFKGEKHFLEHMKQLSNKGPSYALDTVLMNNVIEESESVYFFQAQLNIINMLQSLMTANNLDNIVLYLTSPFDMVKIKEAVPVIKISGDYIFINRFFEKGQVKNNQWYKIKTKHYNSPSPDYFDISSVYSLPPEKFINDTGFINAKDEKISMPVFKPDQAGATGSDVRIRDNTPVFKAWHSITSSMANPETFEDESVVSGYIVVEQAISPEKMKEFKEELGMDLGIALHAKLLFPDNDEENIDYSLNGKKRVKIKGSNFYYSSKNILLNNFTGLSAVTLSPVSVLNELTRALSFQIAFTGIIVMLIAGLLIFLVVQSQIKKPLKKLMDGVALVSEGKLDSRVNIDTKDEFGKLATAFNSMSRTLSRKTDDLYTTVSELEKAQNYISNIINSMPSVLIGVDYQGNITQWNLEAQRNTGLLPEDVLGLPLHKAIPRLAAEMEHIREAIAERCELTDPKRTYQENGETIYENVTIYPLIANGVEGAVIRIEDVTEKVRLEEMMIQSEKMLSVGGLAAGMAHEINNPLAGIMQTAEVMSKRLTDIDMLANRYAAEEIGITMESVIAYMEKRGVLRMITAINESGSRVAEIVNNMLSFARKKDFDTASYDLVALMDKTLKLASTDYDLKQEYDFKIIEIVKEYEDNLPHVPCEGTKIQQVLLNILRNGAQAMLEGIGKGQKPCFILRLAYEKYAGKVRIEIEDNGPGINEEKRKRIFEPFFTTKPVGVGTGLGLSVSYFIIAENHGGELTVESQPGSGTKFIIRLPIERNFP